MKKMSTSDRMQRVKLLSGISSNVALGALAGASKSVVGQWFSGHIKTIAPEYAFALEEKTRFSARWIMLGEGPEIRETQTSPHQSDESIQAVILLMEGLQPNGRAEIRGKVGLWVTEIWEREGSVPEEKWKERSNFDRRTGTR